MARLCCWVSISFTLSIWCSVFFFSNDTATTEIYTLSLHDALPISKIIREKRLRSQFIYDAANAVVGEPLEVDRKSTRLNSSHANISYAVFCLKKKKVNAA